MKDISQASALNDSYHAWSGEQLGQEILEKIQDVVRFNPQSRNRSDQIKQKKLYLDLCRLMPSFEKNSKQPLWTQFFDRHLRDKGEMLHPILDCFFQITNDIDVTGDLWKLWYSVDPSAKEARLISEERVPKKKKRRTEKEVEWPRPQRQPSES